MAAKIISNGIIQFGMCVTLEWTRTLSIVDVQVWKCGQSSALETKSWESEAQK